MNMKMKCYKVLCKDSDMQIHEVKVVTCDEFSAKHCAENSLLEGKNIKAKAVDVVEIKKI